MSTSTTARARITYYAPGRTFVWLYKDQPFLEFKQALRRKLAVSDDASIYIKHIHAGNALDLDNEDEYEAFCDFARTAITVDVQVEFDTSNAMSDSGRQGFLQNLDLPSAMTNRKRKFNDESFSERDLVESQSSISFCGIESSQDQAMGPNNLSAATTSMVVDEIDKNPAIPSTSHSASKKKKTQKLEGQVDNVSATPTRHQKGAAPNTLPRSLGATQESLPVSESPVTSSIKSSVVSPAHSRKRSRVSEKLDDVTRSLQKPEKRKKAAKSATEVKSTTEHVDMSDKLPLVATKNGPDLANSAPSVHPDTFLTLPVLQEVTMLPSSGPAQGEGEKEQEQQLSLVKLSDSSTISSVIEPTIVDLTVDSQKPLKQSATKRKSSASVSAKDVKPQKGKRKAASRAAVKPKSLPKESSNASVEKNQNVPQDTTEDFPESSRVSKKNDDIIAVTASSPGLGHEISITDADPESNKAALVATDPISNRAIGKKTKGVAKTKPPAPMVDIQEIMNQVIAKNRVSQVAPFKTIITQAANASTEEPEKREAQIPEPEAVVVPDTSLVAAQVAIPPQVKEPAPEYGGHRKSGKSQPSRKTSCLVCGQSPFHLRYQCPIVTAGPESIQKRIEELKARQPVPRALIKDLQTSISKATSKQGNTVASSVPATNVPSSRTPADRIPQVGSTGTEGAPITASSTTDIREHKGHISSDDERGVLLKPNPVRDPDDDLFLLLGSELSTSRINAILELISSEEGDEEGHDNIEVENEEEAERSHRMSSGYKYDGSSDDNEVVDDDRESSTEPKGLPQPIVPVVHSRTELDDKNIQKQVHADADVRSDDVVPPTDDEEEESMPRETASPSLQKYGATIQTRSTSAASDLNRPLSRMSELKTSKSVLTYLQQQATDRLDPVESSDDLPPHHSANSAASSTARPAEGTRPVEKSPVSQSNIPLSKRMKSRLGTNVNQKVPPVINPAPALVVEAETLGGNLTAMRPPPTPPWLSGEEQNLSEPHANASGKRKAQSTPLQRPLQRSNVLSQEQSLAEWTTLTPTESPLPIMSQSSMIDELHSNMSEDMPVYDTPAETALSRSRKAPRTKAGPLFFPGTSQYPDSQLPNYEPQNGGSHSDSDQDAREVSTQLQHSRSFISSAPYRRLTDIASQGSVLASPLLTPVAPAPRPKENDKRNLFGDDEDEDEEDEDEDSSSSDSDGKNKSHIPKGRRAGAQHGKKRGLFASL